MSSVGRDQVVGEARVRDLAVARLDLLHQCEPEALRGAALDLALDLLRVDRRADVLGGADPDDSREAELDVDLGDDPHRAGSECDMGALAGDLARLRVERRRRQMAVDPLDVDLAAAARSPLRERGAAGVAHGARDHPGLPRGRGRAGGVDARGRVRARARRRRCRARCGRPGASRRSRPARPRRRRSAPRPSRRRTGRTRAAQ